MEPIAILNSSGQSFLVSLACDVDIPTVRVLVNQAYKELGDMGLNYTATYQDNEITRERMQNGQTFLLRKGDQVVGTIHLREKSRPHGRCAYLGQFGVLPEFKGQGLGRLLMDFVEDFARREGFDSLGLDTAKPAGHLVEMYLRRGYRIIGDTRYEGKTYESWIFEKMLK